MRKLPDLSNPTTLRDLTWDSHKKVENHPLMQAQINGTISQKLMCEWTWVQYVIFSTIEEHIIFLDADINRAAKSFSDWQKMGRYLPKQHLSIQDLQARLLKIGDYFLWAHVYTNYLAACYGGQLIKKTFLEKEGFSFLRYEFEDVPQTISTIRSNLHVNLADEANLSFSMIEAVMNDILESHQ